MTSRELTYFKILKDFELRHNDIINIYPYGSLIYGTSGVNSDEDFILIAKNELDQELSLNKIDLIIWSEKTFLEKLSEHEISALECFFLPKHFLLKNSKDYQFSLNSGKLRKSISEKTSHSWVKAKKKFEVEKDRNIYSAKKSLFHALRIADFGIQMAKEERIVSYDSSNYLWDEIKNNSSERWQDYKNKYQELFNQKMTEFRKLAPK